MKKHISLISISEEKKSESKKALKNLKALLESGYEIIHHNPMFESTIEKAEKYFEK
jgi:predicted CoA-binding protein